MNGMVLSEYSLSSMSSFLCLQNYADDNRHKSLVEYGIRANSHIQLIITSSEETEEETNEDLLFNLDWGFPNEQTVDYLDLTCFLYTGNKFWRKYDYQSTDYPSLPSTKHSGDVLDRTNRRGDFVYMNILFFMFCRS